MGVLFVGRVVGVVVPCGLPVVFRGGGFWVFKNGRPLFRVFSGLLDAFGHSGADSAYNGRRHHPLGWKYYVDDELLSLREKRWKLDFPFPVEEYVLEWIDDKRCAGNVGRVVVPVFGYVLDGNDVKPVVWWRVV